MNALGNPADWADLLDSMVPDILRLTIASWESLPPLPPDERRTTSHSHCAAPSGRIVRLEIFPFRFILNK